MNIRWRRVLTPGQHAPRTEDGFTLIEVLISTTILVIIMSALVGALIAFLTGTKGLSDGLSESHDVQLLTARFPADVEAAVSVSTTLTSCGPPLTSEETVILDLVSGPGRAVTYVYVHPTDGQDPSIERRACTPTEQVSIPAHLVGPAAPVVSICVAATDTCTASTGPVAGSTLSRVTMTVTEKTPNYTSTVQGVPRSAPAAAPPAPVSLLLLDSNPLGLDVQQALPGGFAPDLHVTGQALSNSSIALKGTVSISNGIGLLSGDTCQTPCNPSVTVRHGDPSQVSQFDPFADLPVPTCTACEQPPNPVNPQPGHYSSTLIVPDGARLAPGIYILENGLSGPGGGDASFDGTAGVLLYLKGGSVNIATASLEPPSTGIYKGLMLWQDKADSNQIGSGITSTRGIVYAPTASIAVGGSPLSALFQAKAIIAGSLAVKPSQTAGQTSTVRVVGP